MKVIHLSCKLNETTFAEVNLGTSVTLDGNYYSIKARGGFFKKGTFFNVIEEKLCCIERRKNNEKKQNAKVTVKTLSVESVQVSGKGNSLRSSI